MTAAMAVLLSERLATVFIALPVAFALVTAVKSYGLLLTK
jgi:hypothetical protein